MCLMVWKRTFYGKVDLSTTFQCRQLRLNPLSTQINIYRLMTNQMPPLLVQRVPWTRAAVMLLQSLSFLPPPPLTAIIPDAHPRGTFENQDIRDGKTRYICISLWMQTYMCFRSSLLSTLSGAHSYGLLTLYSLVFGWREVTTTITTNFINKHVIYYRALMFNVPPQREKSSWGGGNRSA